VVKAFSAWHEVLVVLPEMLLSVCVWNAIFFCIINLTRTAGFSRCKLPVAYQHYNRPNMASAAKVGACFVSPLLSAQ
jgi:hypothetical protein